MRHPMSVLYKKEGLSCKSVLFSIYNISLHKTPYCMQSLPEKKTICHLTVFTKLASTDLIILLAFILGPIKCHTVDYIYISCRHTLWRKIQTIVTPLLANLVSVIDQNCNLDLLLDGDDDIWGLWLEIFGSKEMLTVPYVRMESKWVCMFTSTISI